MGDVTCDECGVIPYVGQERSSGDYDARIWCECPVDVPIAFDGSGSFNSNLDDEWGVSGARFVCYRCGKEPELQSTTGMSAGTHPEIRYHLTCGCDMSPVGFKWRGVHPDEWKRGMDPTKWPDKQDEILESVREHGPLEREELTEYVDVPQEGINCLTIRLQRDDRLHRGPDGRLMTPFMVTEYETGTAPEQIDDEEAARSGTGYGWFRKLVSWLGDR